MMSMTGARCQLRTCAAILAAHGLVRLLKALEQLRHGACVDTDARVAHRYMDALLPACLLCRSQTMGDDLKTEGRPCERMFQTLSLAAVAVPSIIAHLLLRWLGCGCHHHLALLCELHCIC
jgi:hypothetical protein